MQSANLSILRAKRLRAGRAPGILLATQQAIVPLSQKIKPTLLVALGYNLIGQAHGEAFTSFYGAAHLANALSLKNPLTGQRVADETERLARAVGELIAIWAFEDQQYTEAQRAEAIVYVQDWVKNNPPPAQEYLAGIRQAFGFIRTAQAGAFMPQEQWNDTLNVTTDRADEAREVRRCLYYQLRLNCIPANVLGANETLTQFTNAYNAWGSVAQVAVPTDADLQVLDTFVNGWTAAEHYHRIAHYERMGFTREKDAREIIVSSLLAYVTCLTKNDTVTPQWRRRHITQLEQQIPGLDLENLIQDDFFKVILQLYPKQGLTVDSAYNGLASVYDLCSTVALGPVMWIIEQGAAHNIALATAFCDSIVKNRNTALDALINCLPGNEFAALATLVGHVAYDRYCTLVDPPIPMSAYPDLAYIGKYIAFMNRDPNATIAYKGNPLKNAILPETSLRAIADALIKGGAAVLQHSLNPTNLYRDAQARIGRNAAALTPAERAFVNEKIFESGGDLYVLDSDEFNTYRNGLDADDRAALDRKITEGLRDDWAKGLKSLPPSANKLTPASLIRRLLEFPSPKAAALMTICDTMVRLCNQTKIAPYEDEQRYLALQRRTQVAGEIIDAINVLGGTVLPEWSIAPAAIPDVNPTDYRAQDLEVRSRQIN